MRLMIAMQFYPGDRDTAMETARLMADTQEKRRYDVGFCFAARRDAEHCPKTVEYVSQKFTTFMFKGKRTETGWPLGPNALWSEVMLWSQQYQRDKGVSWDAILTTESDVVPMSRDWIDVLIAEWDKAKSLGKIICGPLIHDTLCNGQMPPCHINGNAIFESNLTKRYTQFAGTPYGTSWDIHHAKIIVANAYDTPYMTSHHQRKTMDEKFLYQPKQGVTPVFFHGVKDDSARKIVRKKMGI